MKYADIPDKFPIPFAENAGVGYVRDIPEDSQIGINDGFASLDTGFPPLNFLPIGAGGVPPFGQDMNGILKQSTAWDRWVSAGGGTPLYDATFSASIGGYPTGALLRQAAVNGRFWMSIVDDNTSDPDTGGANWISLTMLLSDFIQALFTPTITTIDGPAVGNWTAPSNIAGNKINVRMWGAGGGAGGGGANGCGGAGGNGGSYVEFSMTVVPATNYAYVVPAGGAAGSLGTDGGNGSPTTFAGVASASGGLGGAHGTATDPGLVGNDNPSSTIPAGGRGLLGARGGQGLGPPNTQSSVGGAGGGAPLGGAGGPGATGQGYAAVAPGGGGGGGGGASGSNTNGAPGQPGRLEISYITTS